MKEETPEKKVKSYSEQIRKEIGQWKDINQNGCNDPFWPDGCNMNLVRNHILYYQKKISEICVEKNLPYPEAYYFSVGMYRCKKSICMMRCKYACFRGLKLRRKQMELKEFATMLNGREYDYPQFTQEELRIAKDNGFVIVSGASDDLVELEGAITDEGGCLIGGTISVKAIPDGGIVHNCERSNTFSFDVK